MEEALRRFHKRLEEDVRYLMKLYGIGYDDAVKIVSGRYKEVSPEAVERINRVNKELDELKEEGFEWVEDKEARVIEDE
jgi:hypothetical protein